MTNSYYHAFSVGFNFWYIFVPLSIVLMARMGWRNVHCGKGTIRCCYNDKFYRLHSVIFTLITATLVSFESGRGILQYFDNRLGTYEDPITSVIEASLAVAFVAIGEFCACYFTASLFESLKKNKLKKKFTTAKYSQPTGIRNSAR